MSDWQADLVASLATYGPAALGLIVLIGSAGIPLPITMLVIAAGAMVRQGVIDGPAAAAMALAGSVGGDCVVYVTGWTGGQWVRTRLVRNSARQRQRAALWQQARVTLDQWGGFAVFLTRFLLTPLAIPTNLLAGSSRMEARRWFVWDAAGEMMWVTLYGGLGFLLADNWQAFSLWADSLARVLGLLAIATVAAGLLAREVRKRTLHAKGVISTVSSEPTRPTWHKVFRLSKPDAWREGVVRMLDMPMLFEKPTLFELTLPSVFGSEKLARHTAAWLAVRLEFPAGRIADFQTALSEACINAIEHGNNNRPRRRVKVSFTVTRDTLDAVVEDEGVIQYREVEAVPSTIQMKVAGLAPTRGMGLLLIGQLVDESRFLPSMPGAGNRFLLRMRRSGPALVAA